MRRRWCLLVPLLLSGCDLAPQDEPAGPLHGVSRAHDPANDPGGAADGTAGAAATPAAGSTGAQANAGGPADVSDPTPPASATLAQGLAIDEVALFQGVKVSLAKSGSKVAARTVPAIANRDGLVRVYVTPGASWTPHAVTAELHLVANGQGLPIVRDTKTIGAASTEGDLGSTFDFDVPGSSLPAGVQYFVQLLDSTAPAVATASSNAAEYPMGGGSEAMDTTTGAAALKVVMVPVRYGADGSNRVPDTQPAIVDALRKHTLELYPVPDVQITVHAPIDFGSTIAADGTGWSNVLAAITQLRMQEKPAPDVYYFGVFAPADTIANYCPSSCVLGLSNLGSSVADATTRASVGVLYNSTAVLGTLPHEVGHAHGRYHAPCGGAAGPDPNFPYTDATIGSWGYSIVSKQLINPGAAKTPHDFMSYCSPEWTSDYTFKALFDRGRALSAASVTNLSLKAPIVARPLRILFEEANGTLRWNDQPPVVSDEALGGEERTVTFLGAGGIVLGTSVAHRYTYDHLGGGYFFVPAAPPGTLRVAIAGAGDIGAL